MTKCLLIVVTTKARFIVGSSLVGYDRDRFVNCEVQSTNALAGLDVE
jgi:hypothetical protein